MNGWALVCGQLVIGLGFLKDLSWIFLLVTWVCLFFFDPEYYEYSGHNFAERRDPWRSQRFCTFEVVQNVLFLSPLSLETLREAWPRNADLELPHLEFEIRISVDALESRCSRKSMWRYVE